MFALRASGTKFSVLHVLRWLFCQLCVSLVQLCRAKRISHNAPSCYKRVRVSQHHRSENVRAHISHWLLEVLTSLNVLKHFASVKLLVNSVNSYHEPLPQTLHSNSQNSKTLEVTRKSQFKTQIPEHLRGQ